MATPHITFPAASRHCAQSHWLVVVLCVVAALAGGCRREEIQVYRIPKEQHDHGHDHDHGQQAAVPVVRWNRPSGWQEQPPSQFRVGSFKIAAADGKQAEVSIIPLPGGAGGDLDNVNRWRGQVGLAAVTAEDLRKLAEPVTVAGQDGSLYDLGGETIRILAAMQPRDGTTWFYKMTGDTALVAQQKPAFIEFLKSLQFGDGPAAAVPAQSEPAATKPVWDVPADWQAAEAGQFLVAKYIVTAAGAGQGAVNISVSAGDGGGLAANVNRWRQQLGLDGMSADELAAATKTLTTAVGQGMLIEMDGGTTGIVAVIVPRGSQTWFFKLMGPPAVVSHQKEPFLKFVQEARF